MPEGGPIATAFVEVRPDTSGFGSTVSGEVTGRLRDERGRFIGAGRQIGDQIGEGAKEAARRSTADIVQTLGGLAVVGFVGRTIAQSLREADEARDIAAQTAAAIRSTGAAAGVTAEQVGELSERLSEQIAVDDDLIQQSANLLLTFTKIRNEVGEGNDIFDRAVEVTQDMAAALGTDASSAAIQLGKALNDPIAGLTSLGRAGVQFSDQQKEQIRTLVESNDILGAQRIILAELETQVAGSAAAQASGLDRITVATGNLKESIGGALAPVVEQLVPVVEKVVDAFESLPDAAQSVVVVGGSLAATLGPLGRTVEGYRSLSSAIGRTTAEGSRFASTFRTLGRGGLIVGGLTAAAVGLDALEDSLISARHSAEDFATASEDALVSMMDGLIAAAVGLGGSAEEVFRAFAEGGELGIGILDRYGDALDERGRETTTLRGVLADEAAAQEAVNAATERGADVMGDLTGETRDAGGIFRDAAGDVDRLADALGDVNSEIETAFGLMSSVEEAEAGFRETIRGAFDTARGLLSDDADDSERRDAFLRFLVDARDDALLLAEALGREGVGSDEIVARVQQLIGEAAQLGDDFGLTTGEVDGLLESIGLLPGQIGLIVGGNLAQAREDAEALLRAVLTLALTPVNTIIEAGGGTPFVPLPQSGGGIVIERIDVHTPEPAQSGVEVVRELERQSLLTGQGPRRPI